MQDRGPLTRRLGLLVLSLSCCLLPGVGGGRAGTWLSGPGWASPGLTQIDTWQLR